MFNRRIAFVFIGIVIFVAGTLIGRAAQVPRSDFEIELTESPGLGMKATCVRGCQFIQSRPIDADLRRSIELMDTMNLPCRLGCKALLVGTIVRQPGKAGN